MFQTWNNLHTKKVYYSLWKKMHKTWWYYQWAVFVSITTAYLVMTLHQALYYTLDIYELSYPSHPIISPILHR